MKKGWVEIEVKKLSAAKWNYKNDDTNRARAVMVALKNNIEKNGLVLNLVVRQTDNAGKKFEVLDGNHRLEVLRELGERKAMCYNFGKIKLAHAKRLALEINESNIDADPFGLGEILKDISKSYEIPDLADTIPFTSKKIDDLIRVSTRNILGDLPLVDTPRLDQAGKEIDLSEDANPDASESFRQPSKDTMGDNPLRVSVEVSEETRAVWDNWLSIMDKEHGIKDWDIALNVGLSLATNTKGRKKAVKELL